MKNISTVLIIYILSSIFVSCQKHHKVEFILIGERRSMNNEGYTSDITLCLEEETGHHNFTVKFTFTTANNEQLKYSRDFYPQNSKDRCFTFEPRNYFSRRWSKSADYENIEKIYKGNIKKVKAEVWDYSGEPTKISEKIISFF